MISISIEGKPYWIPSSLMDITLKQRIAYDKDYGKALREQLKKIIDMAEGVLRDIDFASYQMELACKTLAYFGSIPLDVVENTKMDQVLTTYHHTAKTLSEDYDFAAKEFELKNEFDWQGDTWVIAPPELKHDSSMTFGEFLNAKQSVKDLFEVGNEKYEALLALCCVYFRKKDEQYDEKLSREDGPRHKLLETLPFQYALHVGFFLNASLHTWLRTFLSSETVEKAVDLN